MASQSNDRERALQILRRIERESLYATLVLINETGFVRTMVLGVLRWRSRLDASVNAAAPVVVGEYVFISACYQTGAALLRVRPEAAVPMQNVCSSV